MLFLVCFSAALIVYFTAASLALRPQLLTRVLAIVLCMIPTVYMAMVFPGRPFCIRPGPTPHCLRCGYPADAPGPRCPECGVVRTDRTVVLGEPKFLSSDDAHTLWALLMVGVLGAAVMAVVAFQY